MPECGSQILHCDIPVRFDTYKGCSHACAYCFVQRKVDISNIEKGESHVALRRFIEGGRNNETDWCDWDIPLHWGGLSDPFQPVERSERRSLECLKVLAETQYPFVVSTKNKLIAEGEYLDLIKQCNVVVQFSALGPSYNKLERGASTFEERLEAASKISPFKRVVIRVQPYHPSLFQEVLKSIDLFHEAGVYGMTFEGVKYLSKRDGFIKLGGDFVIPVDILKKHLAAFKSKLHAKGMKFYAAENRLRRMGDDLCCCGIDGLGWKANTANLNHFLYDKERFEFTENMKSRKGIKVFSALNQDSVSKGVLNELTFEEGMTLYSNSKKFLKTLMPLDR